MASPFTYAEPAAPVLERAFITFVELLGGLAALARHHEQWRAQWPQWHVAVVERALLARRLARERRRVVAAPGRHDRFVVIANHPSLARSQLSRVPEAIRYFLPIDFNETGDARNIEARRHAPVPSRQQGQPRLTYCPAGGRTE